MPNFDRTPSSDKRVRRNFDRLSSIQASLTSLATLTGTGLVSRIATDTFMTRTITGPAAGITVSNGDGVSGNPTLALANDLAALEALSSTGIACRTGTDAWAQRTLTAPAAGITVSNGSGAGGNPTLALANDLAGLEGLAANGMAARTATDTWTVRTITGTTNQVNVSNGNGVSGNPTLSTPQDIHSGASPTFAGLTITSIVSMSGTSITISDGVNFVFNTTTGTKFGTATNQKQSLWNKTPIVQPAAADQADITLGNTDGAIGGLTISAAYDQAEVQALRDQTEILADDVRNLTTLVRAIRTAMINYGSMKGSA